MNKENKQKLKKGFDKVGIQIFSSKNPLVFWMIGKKNDMLSNIEKVLYHDIKMEEFYVWESIYENKWRTFIKINFNENSEDDYGNIEIYDDDYYPEQTMREAYEYDGPADKFDDWLDGNGY
jgi:hypothetical protein